MATFHTVILAVMSAALVQCQRPSFAGTRPIGFPELPKTTADPLGNRFGESDGTTERLPVEAKGDRDLIDRISKFPIDQQPFWYLNWKALEEHRKNPQTYPQRPSQFASTINSNFGNSGIVNSNAGAQSSGTNSNSGIQSSGTNFNSGTESSGTNVIPGSPSPATNASSGTPSPVTNASSGTQNSGVPNSNIELGNRNGGIDTSANGGSRKQYNTGFQSHQNQMTESSHHGQNRYGA